MGEGLRYKQNRVNNLTAVVDPTTADDTSQGYDITSVWLNTTSGTLWECTDATASAAVWVVVNVLDTSGVLRSDLNTPNTNDPRTYCYGRISDYWNSGSPQSANEVDYVRIPLSKGRVITKMRTFIVSGANGTRQISMGIYDQSTPTSVTGTPNARVATTGTNTPPNATTGYYDVALTSSYTVANSGFYWLALTADNGTMAFLLGDVFRANSMNRREETPGSFGLPATAGATTRPQSAILFVMAVE